MSQEILAAFDQACDDADLALTREVVVGAESAMDDPHYGFVMADNLEAATSFIQRGEYTLPIGSIPESLLLLSGLLKASGEDYRSAVSFADPESDLWAGHVANVRSGKIELLPEELWTSKHAGERQARRADHAFSNSSQRIERVLAALNYGIYFRPETMAGAARTLSRTPEEIAASEELEAMPHLSVSNWAIGQVAQHVYAQMSRGRRGNLHIMDMCSGTGATLAAMTNRLGLAQTDGHQLGDERLSMTGFEITPEFFEQLKSDFLPEAQPHLKSLGVEEVRLTTLSGFDGVLRAGEGRLVQGDVVSAAREIDMTKLDTEEDVLLATANYGFHRLTRQQKQKMIKHFAKAENSILVVGDLRRNASRVNRGYFNLSNNGPLNPGNVGLESDLKEAGYVTGAIGRDGFEPDYVDEPLRNRLAGLLKDDGFVTLAAKGPKAFALLFGA